MGCSIHGVYLKYAPKYTSSILFAVYFDYIIIMYTSSILYSGKGRVKGNHLNRNRSGK